ncbi:MAG: glycerol-3-phosphate dehydrogenase [Bacteroidales bacterium]|nr:glycerol-3-phosphate dehydrogenase [Bacteroidales bacterium]
MIALLGDGSWALGLTHVLVDQNGQRINWWVREEERIDDFPSTPRLRVHKDIAKVVESSDDIFVVIPSAFISASLKTVTPEMLEGKNIISAVKGFLPDMNLTVSQYFHQVYGVPEDRIAIVSGPSHAEEVVQNMLTYLTVASSNRTLAERVRNMLECDYLCTHYSSDVVGIECAAILKNVYAVAVGICHSLGYGDNLIAVLIASALKEMSNVFDAYIPTTPRRDLSSYIYLSDLLATCYSKHSRNHTLGELIGRGYSPQQARLMQKMVAEGYYAVKAVYELSQQSGVYMPIVQALYAVLYQSAGVNREFNALVHQLSSRNLI